MLTAFYVFRLYWLTFGGSFRGSVTKAQQLHESGPLMILPLQVLAAGALVAGFLGVPAVFGIGIPNVIERFLEPVLEPARDALAQVFPFRAEGDALELGVMGVSLLLAAIGIVVAWRFYRGASPGADRLAASFPGAYNTLLHEYWVDEAYRAVFVRGLAIGGGQGLHANDRFVIDGGDGEVRPGLGVNGLAWGVRDLVARAANLWDRYVVDGAVRLTALALENLSYVFRAAQTGVVQQYALGLMIGLFLLIAAGRFLLGLY
jgi:NADH-quinone oxidoreductase subunit L